MSRAFPDQLAQEFAAVVGALIAADAHVEPCEPAGTWDHVIQVGIGGKTSGTATFGVDRAGAATLSRLVMGLDEEPPEAAVVDTMKEVCGQAVGALLQQPDFKEARISGSAVEPVAPQSAPTCVRITAGPEFSAAVAVWLVLDVTSKTAAAAQPAIASAPANLDLILDIDLPLAVRFGETEMTLKRLTRLAPGSVIDLGRLPDDPVDVLVNGRLIARGEVVVVAGNYGVRVTEVISAADRLRTVTL